MDDDELLAQFEAATFPHERWHHRDHIKVAYLYVSRYGLETATEKMRAGIKAYNAAQQTRDDPFTGYHETITIAWLRIVASTIANHGAGKNADDFCDRQPHLLTRTLLRLFYSHDLVCSPAAKSHFLEPDLAPLPRLTQVRKRAERAG